MGGDVAAVELGAVSVTFPRRVGAVLQDVSLRLEPGEQVVVLGPSGSGKSTLLHTLTGVLPHSVVANMTGRVTVFGRSTADISVVELSRRVGVLAQDPDSAVCLPDVEQELALPLENQGADVREISERIGRALAAVGASPLRMRTTATLSGGEGQRVALAASMIGEPGVLLLDEPTAMLDADGIESVREAIAAAVDEYGPAVVLVEHRLDEFAGARGLAGLPARSIVLAEDGRVLADGPTVDVLRAAATDLHAAGCWLPLESELHAVFGRPGGLECADIRAELMALAASEGVDTGTDTPPPRGRVVLAASGLSVRRGMAPARRRRRRRGADAEGAPVLLHEVDLDIREGEIVAVLGANGVGKTSLLLSLAGLLKPAAGEVRGARPGMIFQNPEHQFVSTTVRGEIGHGLSGDFEPIVTDMLVRHRLAHLADQNPYRLSGGEKRRLSVAAMLAHVRPVLLADEPTFGLDRRATVATIRAFRAAAADGRGIVFSSHDLRTVATLAHRAVVIAEGRILADGPIFEVLRDADVLTRARVSVPPLIGWLLDNVPRPTGIRRVLDQLDARVDAPIAEQERR